MKNIIKLLLALFITFSLYPAFSQVESPCAQKLAEAIDEFEEGHFYSIDGLLKDCLKKGFSREQKIQAHYLLTRTYLFLDNPDSAEYHYLRLLKEDPEYRVDEENDPIEIVYLSEKFTTSPILSLNVSSGTNATFINVVNDYNLEAFSPSTSEEDYRVKWGMQVSAGLESHFSDHWSLHINPTYFHKNWQQHNGSFDDKVTSKSDTMIVSEATNSLNVPIMIRYTMNKIKYRPYAYLGYMQSVLFFSQRQNEGFNSEGETRIPITGPSKINLSMKAILWGNVVAGGGIQYKVGVNYFYFDAQYSYGLGLENNPYNRYPEKDGHYPFEGTLSDLTISDDIAVNNLFFSLGFVKPLYKPRKKDKFTLRTWFDEVSTKLLKKGE